MLATGSGHLRYAIFIGVAAGTFDDVLAGVTDPLGHLHATIDGATEPADVLTGQLGQLQLGRLLGPFVAQVQHGRAQGAGNGSLGPGSVFTLFTRQPGARLGIEVGLVGSDEQLAGGSAVLGIGGSEERGGQTTDGGELRIDGVAGIELAT